MRDLPGRGLQPFAHFCSRDLWPLVRGVEQYDSNRPRAAINGTKCMLVENWPISRHTQPEDHGNDTDDDADDEDKEQPGGCFRASPALNGSTRRHAVPSFRRLAHQFDGSWISPAQT